MTQQEALRLLRSLINEAVAQKSDVYYEYKVEELARIAGRVFSKEDHRTQMKNLERVALNATAMADVLNYIKSQAGKQTRAGELWQTDHFAKLLHDAIWNTVRVDAENVAKNVWKALKNISQEAVDALRTRGYSEVDLRREVRLHLVRVFVQHLVAHYYYNQLIA